MPHACEDCVNVHGDTPAEWLARWPQGAEWREEYGTYLCDGCAEERDDSALWRAAYPREDGDQ